MNDTEKQTDADKLDQAAAEDESTSEQSGLQSEQSSRPRVIRRPRKEPPSPDTPDYGDWTMTTIASREPTAEELGEEQRKKE